MLLPGTPIIMPTKRETKRQSAAAPIRAAPIRFVTAASLFDGHDAAINIVRRILQSAGAEVIHLGHNAARTRMRHGSRHHAC